MERLPLYASNSIGVVAVRHRPKQNQRQIILLHCRGKWRMHWCKTICLSKLRLNCSILKASFSLPNVELTLAKFNLGNNLNLVYSKMCRMPRIPVIIKQWKETIWGWLMLHVFMLIGFLSMVFAKAQEFNGLNYTSDFITLTLKSVLKDSKYRHQFKAPICRKCILKILMASEYFNVLLSFTSNL